MQIENDIPSNFPVKVLVSSKFSGKLLQYFLNLNKHYNHQSIAYLCCCDT
jgi:hypothetical protein